MLGHIGAYRSALYLTAAIALTEFALLSYLLVFALGGAEAAAIRLALALAIVFGLWVHSKAARYLGALWFVISVGSVIWPLISGTPIVLGFGAIWALVLSALCLTASYVLLLSKQFGEEFRRRRETQPPYKRTLRKVAVVVVIVIIVVATAVDVYRLLEM